ncbi:winged helix-turn-helix domain-containing protein [Acidiferrimicrobium sp. IK]|uniref:winged helix-turn-helix domain-containing protein n=1 Tax=Acidiferrimicrobium sp. IK TaxID=2871700 RepID=UPI0021CB2C7A|nr:winged helix-turn-helix domain-containing protein [Acidiferrimicrobium sp. IK]MCU4183465.1 winged helix-turn-helix domain-containing protein [Acidiferrimicrobium sp. IK]
MAVGGDAGVAVSVAPSQLTGDVCPDYPVLLVGPVDDDAPGLRDWLGRNGWLVTLAPDADRARWLASIQKISVALLTGPPPLVWSTVHAIRPVTLAPIVVLGSPPADDAAALVAAGVDAIVEARSGTVGIAARIAALVRRADSSWEPGVRFLAAGDLCVDLRAQQCRLRDQPLHLSPTEYALLTFLMRQPGQALTTEVIVRKVWGWLPTDGRNTLRIFVNRLRRKLDDDPRQPRYIASVRGTGYRFAADVTELGDVGTPGAAPGDDGASLLRAVTALSQALAVCRSVEDAGAELLARIDETGYADAMAVFRTIGEGMRLVAERHMPPAWHDRVADGVPLLPSFASAHSVMTNEPVQFADIAARGEQFTATADHLVAAGYRACLFLPILRDDRVWGHLGLVRRSPEAFDATGTAFLRAMCAVFSLGLNRSGALRPLAEPLLDDPLLGERSPN